MIEVVKYTPDYKIIWDELVNSSRNGTFLFYRDYMDYHADRFIDSSFIFLKKGKVEALFPGNLDGSTLYSHQGLTYGGLISSSKICTTDILAIFKELNTKLLNIGIQKVIYKPIPQIYHSIPAQEDIYALFKLNAVKIGCHISSTIFQNKKIKFIESRKSGIRKSIREGVLVRESEDFNSFWEILNNNLKGKFDVRPVHSIDEICLLHSRFPENIKLYLAEIDGETIAGTVLFIMKNIIHVQYISASEKGKIIGALDLLFDKLINDIYESIPIFDFGQSSEKMGNYLNDNLIFQKEGFGGRGIVYEIYQYSL